VGDVQESFHYVKYKYQDNQLVPFADDTSPRWLTTACQLDYHTMAGADKFGNFFIDRLPEEVSEEIDDDPSANKVFFERGYLNGAPHKVPFRFFLLLYYPLIPPFFSFVKPFGQPTNILVHVSLSI